MVQSHDLLEGARRPLDLAPYAFLRINFVLRYRWVEAKIFHPQYNTKQVELIYSHELLEGARWLLYRALHAILQVDSVL